MTTREDMRNMLDYFWNEKGDIERWSSFNRDELMKEYPEVIICWDNYKNAEKILSAVIRGLEE